MFAGLTQNHSWLAPEASRAFLIGLVGVSLGGDAGCW